MSIALLVACTADGVIGRSGVLPWRLPADMRHFQSLTRGHTVVMGRKTYDSLYIRPLPDRRNIVLSRNRSLRLKECELIHDIKQLSSLVSAEQTSCFVIGGGEVFKQFFPYAERIHQTIVHAQLHGEVCFPPINPKAWYREGDPRRHPADEQNEYAMTFVNWRRTGEALSLP